MVSKRGTPIALCGCLLPALWSPVAFGQVTANSLAELRNFGTTLNNTTITLSPTGGDPHPVAGIVVPGHYWINGDHIVNPTSSMPIFMDLNGNGNTYNFAGTTINLDTRKLDGFGRALGHDSGVDVIQINGSNNTVNDLTLIGQDIDLINDPNAQRYADWATQYVELSGTNNTVDGVNVVTRGSRTDTYGLSDAFGKGSAQGMEPFIAHRKASAFRVGEATNAVVNDMHLEVNTFGHGFFVQASTNTTLTNSTVTGELFSSQLVVDHPEYQAHGHTWWGEPIPNDIMLSGAEGGVRMYNGASGLTVDNVIVDGMRTGFATVHAGGNVSINNSFARNTTSGFDVGDNTTITNSGGNIVNGPLLVWYTSGAGDSTVELDIEGGTPIGTNWSAIYLNGDNVDLTLTSSLPEGALPEESYIRLGQSYFENWRNFDYNTAGPEDASGEEPIALTNATFENNTNQILVIGENVTGVTGSSQAPVISNGKQNFYDGITLVPAGIRTVVVHSGGLGNNGTASDGSLDANATVVQAGGTLELSPGIQINDEKLTISGIGVDFKGALYSDGQVGSGTRFGNSSGSNESTIFLDGNAGIGVGIAGNQMLVGRIQGTGDLIKLGPGKLSVEKSSTFVGNVIVGEGTVVGRSGFVPGDLAVSAGATAAALGSNMINSTTATADIDGVLDLNTRTDFSALTQRVGRLTGSGLITVSNTNALLSTIEIAGDADSQFDGSFSGSMLLVKSGAGTLTLAGDGVLNDVDVLGGTLSLEGQFQAPTAVADAGATLAIGGPSADVRIDQVTVNGGGALALAGGVFSTDLVFGSLESTGGTLSPGQSIGTTTLTSGMTQSGAGKILIELGGTSGSQSDKLNIIGAFAQGGLFEAVLINGFVPVLGNSFDVIDAGSFSGAYDQVVLPTLTAGLHWDTALLETDGILSITDTPPLPEDLDGDGDVDDADFGIAFAAFTGPNNGPSGNPAADLDGDGDVDDADFGIAFAAFTGPNGSANVPEPASLALLGLGGLLVARRRRA